MHNDQSSLLSASNLSRKVVAVTQDLIPALDSSFALAQAAGATTIIECAPQAQVFILLKE